jgi:uncharacterized protein
MIFLDTSGVLALAMEVDSFHDKALEIMETAEAAREAIVVHNYVLVETAALLQSRIGFDAAIAFLESAALFDVVWVDSRLHKQAVEYLRQHGTSNLSFVDVASFLVMRSRGITDFIGFDKHFTEAGFTQYGSKDTQ